MIVPEEARNASASDRDVWVEFSVDDNFFVSFRIFNDILREKVVSSTISSQFCNVKNGL